MRIIKHEIKIVTVIDYTQFGNMKLYMQLCSIVYLQNFQYAMEFTQHVYKFEDNASVMFI